MNFTDKLTRFIEKIIYPIARPVSHWILNEERKRPTWQYESFFVFVVLCTVAVFTSPHPSESLRFFLINWLSVAGVMGSFLHANVGSRMSESLGEVEFPPVSCYKQSGMYWLYKEIVWFSIFLLSGAYPAIIGNIIFILYPAWREVHIKERNKLRGKKCVTCCCKAVREEK